MYQKYEKSKIVNFNTLVGMTLKSVINHNDEILFETIDGKKFRQVYYQDCCAFCTVEDICGDLQDLIGAPILLAEESSSTKPDEKTKAHREKEKAEYIAKNGEDYWRDLYDSETWTFYKAATIKGAVTIRWYGSSNGYYSESATFEEISI